jgi:chromosome segregation ATPase
MGEAVATTEASIHEIKASLDLLHGNLARIDTTQQQLMAQLGLLSDGVQESTRRHDEAARHLEALDHRVGSAAPTRDLSRGRPPSQEEDDADPGDHAPHGKATLRPAHVTWTGNAPGASWY